MHISLKYVSKTKGVAEENHAKAYKNVLCWLCVLKFEEKKIIKNI